MTRCLDYAPGSHPAVGFAIIAVLLSLGGAVAATCITGDGLRDYLGTFGGCATGRSDAVEQIAFCTPIACLFSTGGWWLSTKHAAYIGLCRTGLLVSLVTWGGSWIYVSRWFA